MALESMQRYDPGRMDGLDVLSTTLWHLKREVRTSRCFLLCVGGGGQVHSCSFAISKPATPRDFVFSSSFVPVLALLLPVECKVSLFLGGTVCFFVDPVLSPLMKPFHLSKVDKKSPTSLARYEHITVNCATATRVDCLAAISFVV